jgi:hypothetical protein
MQVTPSNIANGDVEFAPWAVPSVDLAFLVGAPTVLVDVDPTADRVLTFRRSGRHRARGDRVPRWQRIPAGERSRSKRGPGVSVAQVVAATEAELAIPDVVPEMASAAPVP